MIEAEEAEVHLSDFMDGVGDVVLWESRNTYEMAPPLGDLYIFGG